MIAALAETVDEVTATGRHVTQPTSADSTCLVQLAETLRVLEEFVDVQLLADDLPPMDPWVVDEDALVMRLVSL